MQLIAISDTVLINPEMISTVEMRITKGKKMMVITIGSNQYVVENDPQELFTDLSAAGMKAQSAHWQYWAG